MPKNCQKVEKAPLQAATRPFHAPARTPVKIGNSVENKPGVDLGDWEIERLEVLSAATQADTSMSSYKAQPAKISRKNQELWQAVKQVLRYELTQPTYKTWIAPCQLIDVEGKFVTLGVGSDFHIQIIERRYGLLLRQVFANALECDAIRLRYKVISDLGLPEAGAELKDLTTGRVVNLETGEISAPHINTAVNPKYPLARFQNPTNNPQVADLLNKYGDIRGVMLNHPPFKNIQKPIDQGGWGTGLAGLISMAKTHTLERVLWAKKQADEYQGANDRGAIFTTAVIKGLEKKG